MDERFTGSPDNDPTAFDAATQRAKKRGAAILADDLERMYAKEDKTEFLECAAKMSPVIVAFLRDYADS